MHKSIDDFSLLQEEEEEETMCKNDSSPKTILLDHLSDYEPIKIEIILFRGAYPCISSIDISFYPIKIVAVLEQILEDFYRVLSLMLTEMSLDMIDIVALIHLQIVQISMQVH